MKTELSLQEIQKCALDVLSKFDEICIENGFKYWLSFGTLIGAIRHNGFIPWDDDIDVMMPRKDFDKFIQFAKENEKALYPFRLHDRSNTQNYWYGIPRFSNMEYKYVVDDKYEKPFDIGVFIDIYPMDNYGDSIEEAEILFNHCKKLNRQYDWYINSVSQGNIFRTIIKKILHIYMRVTKSSSYSQEIDNEIRSFILNNSSDDNRYCGHVAFAQKLGRYDKQVIQDMKVIRHVFEDREFNIPENYQHVLKGYGDFMQFPPESERHPTHNYKVYKR